MQCVRFPRGERADRGEPFGDPRAFVKQPRGSQERAEIDLDDRRPGRAQAFERGTPRGAIRFVAEEL